MSIKADISHFFALMKYILDNVDDRQISMMASFRKKISNTLIFARLSHKVVQYDQIQLRYVQVICVVDVFGDALIKLDSRHRSHQEYFINIGPQLASKINGNLETSIQKYLTGNFMNSMFLNPITENEMISEVLKLKDNKSPGYDEINAKII
jgi:hypothetical protein